MVTITKTGTGHWVTFTISQKSHSESIHLKGEWNQWKPQKMKRKKNGSFTCRKKVSPGSYQFGYLLSDGSWITDQNSDTIISPIGTYNSLLVVGD